MSRVKNIENSIINRSINARLDAAFAAAAAAVERRAVALRRIDDTIADQRERFDTWEPVAVWANGPDDAEFIAQIASDMGIWHGYTENGSVLVRRSHS